MKKEHGWGTRSELGNHLMKLWGFTWGRGHIKIKPIRCKKKGCKSCPHMWYAYLVNGEGSYGVEKYLGTCEEDGTPRERYK